VAKKNKKQTPLVNRLVFITMLLTTIVTISIYYYNKPKFVRYPAFGIDIPVNYTIHGIDVSKYQGKIDWNEVK